MRSDVWRTDSTCPHNRHAILSTDAPWSGELSTVEMSTRGCEVSLQLLICRISSPLSTILLFPASFKPL